MRKKTLRTRIMCGLLTLVFLASLFNIQLPAEAKATTQTIPIQVGGQTFNVTPGQWVTVNNGGTTASYNVRYVNGKAVALDVKQYTSLVLGETAGATAASNVAQSAKTSTTAAQASQSTTTAQAAQQTTVTTGKTKTGSWIKSELAEYGAKIKNNFTAGKEAGNAVGTKTVDTVKNGAQAVGEGVSTAGSKVGGVFKSIGSKIGGALKSAKDKVTGLFKKNDTAANGKGSSNAKQSGETAQQSGKTSQTTEQAAQSGKDSGKKEGLLSKLKNKASSGLKSGYETGKAMTKQGVQNVKDSLKSGFSAKNILMTAGITVATDVATQIMRGEQPSLKKALKTVCCAEFAGSVVGSVTGAAAGSFFTPFLSAIPVVGGVLSALAPTMGSVIGSSVGAYLAGDLKNGRFSIKDAFKSIDWAGVVGQSIGSTAGAAIGSCLGPVGTIIGGIVGGYAGNWVAQKLKSWFGGKGTSYGSIGMPVGTTTMKGSVASNIVTIGSSDNNSSVTTEVPVAMSSQIPVSEVTVSSKADTMGTYNSELQLAQAKYQELYKLYNEMLSQGRQEDAIKVAQEMNLAKAQYESLKSKAQ